MRRIILFLFLILFHGCSFNNPFLHEEVNKVTVVKYTPYMKQHRAFLSRSDLKILKNGKKYLYLYHKKNNDFAVLVKRKNTFLLYILSNPKQKPYALRTRQKKKYTYAVNHFKSMGYRTFISPSKKGFIVSVSHKRYKGIKTLLFEVKDYTRLLKLYKKSIREYNATPIKTIKTVLPKSLIWGYYKHYKKQVKNKKQREQLQIIANKLQIKSAIPTKESTQTSSINTKISKETIKEKQDTKESSKTKEHSAWYDFTTNKTEEVEEIQEQTIQKKPVPVPYTYYSNTASLDELRMYLSKDTTKKSLSSSKYFALKQRENNLKDNKLLKEGSLEELIAAYKHNKKPKFKKRILSLMKEKQQ